MDLKLEKVLTYSFPEVDQNQGGDAHFGPKCLLLFPFEAWGSCSGAYGIHSHGDPPNPGVSPVSGPNVASNDGHHINSIHHPFCNHHDGCG